MEPVIKVTGLGKQYHIGGAKKPYRTLRESITDAVSAPFTRRKADDVNSFWALKDVNFEIMPGEVVGIIGRNGAGKSTLLKVLSRITDPTEGEIDITGRVGSLLEVGTGFHPELTGRENVYLNGAILGMKRGEIAQKFDEIVAFAETEKFLDTPVKFYSSGMYTRLAFAVAAHLEPEILIVDEVLAVGDAQFQQKCMGKMKDVSQAGRTVIFVSHTMAAIQQLCTRVILMKSGRLDFAGPATETIGKYLSDAVATQDGNFDLTEHPARSRSHEPIIRHVRLSAGLGAPSSATFFPEDGLQVEFTIHSPTPIREARLAVAVEDSTNRRIFTIASYFGGRNIGDIGGDCVVRCNLGRLDLGAGRYLFSVSISDKYRGLIDSVDGAGWFEVGWRNNFGNGEPYHTVYGPVLKDSIWEMASGEPGVAPPA